jgi:hypothetical protein
VQWRDNLLVFLVVILKLLTENWVDLLEILQYKQQFFWALNQIKVMQSCSSANDEVILFLIKQIIIILEALELLKLFRDNKGHVAEAEHDVALH